MGNLPAGVYKATKLDSTEYYRVSITYRNKHISLGSFDNIKTAAKVYRDASKLINSTNYGHIDLKTLATNYKSSRTVIPFEKWIILINFRDNGIYIKTPIYVLSKYFLYFIDAHTVLKFDVDDLFYYSTHKIMTRDGYFFTNDYGMQTSILARYGIKRHAVCNRDYTFVNSDTLDYRYGNIKVINRFFGVQAIIKNGITVYKVKIHIKGDYVVGTYKTEIEAAIAYNKAIDILNSLGYSKDYSSNYIEDINAIEYASIYNAVRISKRIRELPRV